MTTAPAHEAFIRAIEQYTAAQRSLAAYTKAAWPVVEPGTYIKWNWHHNLICNKLERVARGELTRLIINIPPGSTKTTIATIMFPTWVWTWAPAKRFLTISHGQDLATDGAIDSRAILESDWYRRAWGYKVVFTRDQREKTRYMNTARGYRMSFGMMAGGTGEHGDILIFDDPHDAKRAMYSKAILDAGVQEYRVKWANRLNDPEKSAIVIISQRLAPGDLPGYLLDHGDWDHLCIPFSHELQRACEGDPRTAEGQLYWPEQQNEKYLKEQSVNLGAYGVAGQLQQRPTPLTGGLIDLAWFGRYDVPPHQNDTAEVVQFWDTAQKGNELINSPWVCLTAARGTDGRYYIINVYREWHNYPEGKRAVKDLRQRFSPISVVIEDKSTGQSLLQELPVEDVTGIFLPFEPEGDKVARLAVEADAIRAGKVLLPRSAPWLNTFEQEIMSVPAADYMDQADGLSMMLKWFRERTLDIGDDFASNTEEWPE